MILTIAGHFEAARLKTMATPESLRTLAAQCRSLARQTAHGGTAAILLQMAADYDAQAERPAGGAERGPRPVNAARSG